MIDMGLPASFVGNAKRMRRKRRRRTTENSTEAHVTNGARDAENADGAYPVALDDPGWQSHWAEFMLTTRSGCNNNNSSNNTISNGGDVDRSSNGNRGKNGQNGDLADEQAAYEALEAEYWKRYYAYCARAHGDARDLVPCAGPDSSTVQQPKRRKTHVGVVGEEGDHVVALDGGGACADTATAAGEQETAPVAVRAVRTTRGGKRARRHKLKLAKILAEQGLECKQGVTAVTITHAHLSTLNARVTAHTESSGKQPCGNGGDFNGDGDGTEAIAAVCGELNAAAPSGLESAEKQSEEGTPTSPQLLNSGTTNQKKKKKNRRGKAGRRLPRDYDPVGGGWSGEWEVEGESTDAQGQSAHNADAWSWAPVDAACYGDGYEGHGGVEEQGDGDADDAPVAAAPYPSVVVGHKRLRKNPFGPAVAKYWAQRYRMFRLFDRGIMTDEEGIYSVTFEVIASHIARRFGALGSGADGVAGGAAGGLGSIPARNLPRFGNGMVVIDAFCGIGGNSVQFARTCSHVIAIDIDPVKLACAANNARVYGVEDRIDFILGDFMHLAPLLHADAVFLSPPWGGPDYLCADEYDIEMMIPMNGIKVYEAARKISPSIAYFLPRNPGVDQLMRLAGDGGLCEVEQNMVNNKTKAITAYYGGLVACADTAD